MIDAFVRIVATLAIACLAFTARAQELSVLARVGPWPVADQLVAYRGRIWFSTSVKGVDHNSADIWSFDPATGATRFERFLFSQDAGHPIVHRGLLYWPHEDMRIGLGTGVVSVTDGEDWRELFVPVGDHMMHTHAAAEWRGELVVAMAGWNAALAASANAGASWRVLANDPPAKGSFHRYNDLAVLGDRLFVRHWSRDGPTLKEFRDGLLIPAPGWPQSRFFSRFTRHDGALYALVDSDDGATELWRIGEGPAERLSPASRRIAMRLLVSDGEALWIVGRAGADGRLWKSTDGRQFQAAGRFHGGIAYSAAALAPGKIYIGGEGRDGRAIVWGPLSLSKRPVGAAGSLPETGIRPDPDFDTERNRAFLLSELQDARNYKSHGLSIRQAIVRVLADRPPSGFFASLLDAPMPSKRIDVFGGQFAVQAHDIGRWHLIAAMARNRDPTVPVDLLKAPWERRSNRPQKWFDPLLIALHAVQLSGQGDRKTIDALIARLDRDDPDWLQSQVVGTLAAVTDERFGYDAEAWKDWWASVRAGWSG